MQSAHRLLNQQRVALGRLYAEDLSRARAEKAAQAKVSEVRTRVEAEMKAVRSESDTVVREANAFVPIAQKALERVRLEQLLKVRQGTTGAAARPGHLKDGPHLLLSQAKTASDRVLASVLEYENRRIRRTLIWSSAVLVMAVLILAMVLGTSGGAQSGVAVTEDTTRVVPLTVGTTTQGENPRTGQSDEVVLTTAPPVANGAPVLDVKAVIQDPDGYTNVRSAPTRTSRIVDRVYEGDVFHTRRVDGDWWQVRTSRGTAGYMHVSRIRVLEE